MIQRSSPDSERRVLSGRGGAPNTALSIPVPGDERIGSSNDILETGRAEEGAA